MDIIFNKKALHEYFILEKYECGIVLEGSEVKSLRQKKVNISDSYVTVRNNEIFLLNMSISKFMQSSQFFDHEERRTRKLLLHKSEIIKLSQKILEKHLTVIPLRVFLKKNLFKVEIALVRGKQLFDKRQTEKEKSIEREMKGEIKKWK